jgi:hypothetical protein
MQQTGTMPKQQAAQNHDTSNPSAGSANHARPPMHASHPYPYAPGYYVAMAPPIPGQDPNQYPSRGYPPQGYPQYGYPHPMAIPMQMPPGYQPVYHPVPVLPVQTGAKQDGVRTSSPPKEETGGQSSGPMPPYPNDGNRNLDS